MAAASSTSEKSGHIASKIGTIWFGVRVDAPHPQEAELGACTPRVLVDQIEVAQLGGDVVRGDDAVGERGRGDLALGAGDQGVVELAGAFHG